MTLWRPSGAGVGAAAARPAEAVFNSLSPSTPLADLRELNRIDCCFRRINIIRLFSRA